MDIIRPMQIDLEAIWNLTVSRGESHRSMKKIKVGMTDITVRNLDQSPDGAMQLKEKTPVNYAHSVHIYWPPISKCSLISMSFAAYHIRKKS